VEPTVVVVVQVLNTMERQEMQAVVLAVEGPGLLSLIASRRKPFYWYCYIIIVTYVLEEKEEG
jgi:hypothetical protein